MARFQRAQGDTQIKLTRQHRRRYGPYRARFRQVQGPQALCGTIPRSPVMRWPSTAVWIIAGDVMGRPSGGGVKELSVPSGTLNRKWQITKATKHSELGNTLKAPSGLRGYDSGRGRMIYFDEGGCPTAERLRLVQL